MLQFGVLGLQLVWVHWRGSALHRVPTNHSPQHPSGTFLRCNCHRPAQKPPQGVVFTLCVKVKHALYGRYVSLKKSFFETHSPQQFGNKTQSPSLGLQRPPWHRPAALSGNLMCSVPGTFTLVLQARSYVAVHIGRFCCLPPDVPPHPPGNSSKKPPVAIPSQAPSHPCSSPL